MGKNTSISLGNHFEEFVQTRIREGRYTNASEVIRAGLRLLEEEEQKFYALRNNGLQSEICKDLLKVFKGDFWIDHYEFK